MKRFAAVVAVLAVPAVVLAADQQPGGGGFSFLAVFLQMLASLALVLGVLFLFYYVTNRWFKLGAVAKTGERHIRLVETRYLAPKKSLVLVEVAGEYLLLGSSGDRLNFIKQIDILEEIEVVEDETKRPPFATVFQGTFDAVAAKITAMKQGRADTVARHLRRS
ncbi:flagellar protein [Geotalea uraniireducens]|uniref:Flagellar protein n=1 Tax=Geotalea uraniireducens TaxID=351604 RepID=A0ABM8EGC5_9BACT|nr:flagellar biosynthetic protein FliO [Geotalea uraniireducens]BDV41461.1 flagellar protein [Geotalea uraniireducens]